MMMTKLPVHVAPFIDGEKLDYDDGMELLILSQEAQRFCILDGLESLDIRTVVEKSEWLGGSVNPKNEGEGGIVESQMFLSLVLTVPEWSKLARFALEVMTAEWATSTSTSTSTSALAPQGLEKTEVSEVIKLEVDPQPHDFN